MLLLVYTASTSKLVFKRIVNNLPAVNDHIVIKDGICAERVTDRLIDYVNDVCEVHINHNDEHNIYQDLKL